ncbi:MAG: OmpA family protein [Saprospiraceae bacterium]|nr:OmpA family protein [Saprospiraceae bacterium]
MPRVRFLLFLFLMSGLHACVKPKVYQAEIATRAAAEAREKVLVKELLERRQENANLIKQLGELNRTIGNQEEEIKDLNAELSARTQKLGESSSKLAGEKAAVENELASTRATLAKRNALLESVQKAQQERKKALEELRAQLTKQYAGQADVSVVVEGEAVLLSLPDKTLFDAKNGQEISNSGKALLSPLAQILTERPEVSVEVVSHTDNALPKDKTLLDTWDWSLRRATNLVRLLVRDFNVNANQLTPVGKGEYYPLTSNATAEGRQKNRRTVVMLKPAVPAVPMVE